MKTCITCRTTKPLDQFNTSRAHADGHFPYCTACRAESSKAYARSKRGNIMRIHMHQKGNAKRRGMHAPTYTSEELYDWCMGQAQYHALYDTWAARGFDTAHAPKR